MRRLIDAYELNKTLGIDSDRCSTCSWGYRGRCSRGCDFEDACCAIEDAPTIDAVEVVRCKDCKHWRRQTNYTGAQLSFGFCESNDMWGSLYGETCEVSHIDTDDDFYCGYAERREDGEY